MGLLGRFTGGAEPSPRRFGDAIKAAFDDEELYYEDKVSDDGTVHCFYMRNELVDGIVVRVAVFVDEEDADAKITIFDIAHLDDDAMRTALLWKMNTWNTDYLHTKFFLDEGREVMLDMDIALDMQGGAFQPQNLVSMIDVGMATVQAVYDELMECCAAGPRQDEEM